MQLLPQTDLEFATWPKLPGTHVAPVSASGGLGLQVCVDKHAGHVLF